MRRVEISRDGHISMTMLVGGHPCRVILGTRGSLSRDSLVDARIRLGGVLRRLLPPDKDGNTILVIESGEHLVQALLPGIAPPWAVGSVVELPGVCELDIQNCAG